MALTPGFYRHFKGNYYYLIGSAVHSETLSPMIVYLALYDNPHGRLWVRPAEMWEEQVIRPEYTGPRFVPVPAADVPAACRLRVEAFFAGKYPANAICH